MLGARIEMVAIENILSKMSDPAKNGSPQPPGASRTLLLFGIAVSAVTSLGLHLLMTDLQPAASRAADARRTITRLHRKLAFVVQDHDNRFDHQQRADRAIWRPPAGP